MKLQVRKLLAVGFYERAGAAALFDPIGADGAQFVREHAFEAERASGVVVVQGQVSGPLARPGRQPFGSRRRTRAARW